MHSRELLARERKARAIADWLLTAGYSADAAEQFSDLQRLDAADQAGQRTPSDTTWAVVISFMGGGDGLSAVEQIAHKQDPALALADAARHLADLKAQRKELDLRIEEAEDAVIVAMGDEWTVTLPEFGTVKRYSGKQRKSWDHEGLFTQVLRESGQCTCRIVDEDTGEVESDAEHALRHVRESAGVGYWKITGLRKLHIEADEFAETTTGRPTVQIIAS